MAMNALATAGSMASAGMGQSSPATVRDPILRVNPNNGAVPTPGSPVVPATNALAPVQAPAPDPGAAYQAQYAKSMAAARGAVAAQMASQMAEINAAQTAGTNMANQMPGQYNALQQGENKSLAGLAANADAGEAKTGIKSLGSATGTTDQIQAAGQMATDFDKGAVPMLQQGVQATAVMNRNALAQAQAAANAQLDEQQASFSQAQANTAEQERFSTAQSNAAWARDPSNPDSPAYKAALTLKGLNPDGTPTQAAQDAASLQSTQDALDKANVTAFTAAQAVHTRQTPMYKYIDSQLSKGATSSQLFNSNELNDPGTKLALQVWEYDHGHDPSAVSGIVGRNSKAAGGSTSGNALASSPYASGGVASPWATP